jgi:hypothetical protein
LQEKLRSTGVPCDLMYPGATGVKYPTLEAALLEMLLK